MPGYVKLQPPPGHGFLARDTTLLELSPPNWEIAPWGYALGARSTAMGGMLQPPPQTGYGSGHLSGLMGCGCGGPVGCCGGLGGLGDLPPEQYLSAARGMLTDYAATLDDILQGLTDGDRPWVDLKLKELGEAYDLSETGWQEGRASKMSALSSVRRLLAEIDMAEPSWWASYMGAPPKEVEGAKAGVVIIATRLRNRAASPDFDKAALTAGELAARGIDPNTHTGAVVTGSDAEAIISNEAIHDAMIRRQDEEARRQQCRFSAVLTNEIGPYDYAKKCVWEPLPTGVKVAAGGVVLIGLYAMYKRIAG